MKTNTKIDNIVKEFFTLYKEDCTNFYTDNSTIRMCIFRDADIMISDRCLRASIQRLRNTGQVRLLVGYPGKGYKFATTEKEITDYMKSLRNHAMQFHKLFASEKEQAEHDFGRQINIEL
jgi:hypothetical protein